MDHDLFNAIEKINRKALDHELVVMAGKLADRGEHRTDEAARWLIAAEIETWLCVDRWDFLDEVPDYKDWYNENVEVVS